MQNFIKTTRSGGVFRIALDRAQKRNALNRAFLLQLEAAVAEAVHDDAVRVLLLAAEGPVFCAGMDLTEMEARASSATAEDDWLSDSQIYAKVVQTIYQTSFPTIAVVQGPAVAGGVGLVAACDLVICATDAFFALPEPARGIVAAMVTPLLMRRIGPGPATHMLLSGERCSAETALRNGFCYDVVSRQDLNDRVNQLTAAMELSAPEAMAKTKAYLEQCRGRSLSDDLQAAIQVSADARNTLSAREGLQAYLEKRKPQWQESL